MMRMGGNEKFNSFLSQYQVPKTLQISQKYNTSAAMYYREKLNAEVNGLPLPTKLPEVYNPSAAPSPTMLNSTEPLTGESEADYVARQRRLQEDVSINVLFRCIFNFFEQARERMRQKFGASNGLNSSGKMQGIGSNPNYNANSGKGGEWVPPVDVNQIADASSKALNYVSSTLSIWGEQVVKVTNFVYFFSIFPMQCRQRSN
jgi:hypothetical protein